MSIEQNLTLFHEMIGCGHELYYAVFDTELSLLDSNCPFAQVLPVLLELNEDSAFHVAQLAVKASPAVYSGSTGLMWILDFFRENGVAMQYHFIGPVFVEDIPSPQLEASLSALGFSGREKRLLSQQMARLPLFPINHLLDYGLMQHYCLTGERIDLNAFDFVGDSSDKKESGTDASVSAVFHGTWAMEQELLRMVEEGNPEYRTRAAQLVGKGRMSPLGNGDTLRHFKNITIIFTSLCARAAIRGGLTPEVSYSLSDRYILQIEAARSFDEIAGINSAMQDDFVMRVHECKTSGTIPLAQKLCHYIDVHLEEDLRVAELAQRMGCSESYLSRVFRKQTGMTVSEYICRQRILRAKDALLDSTEPVQNICHRLGFGSHSYFTEQFKKRTGMTPIEYRMKNGVSNHAEP